MQLICFDLLHSTLILNYNENPYIIPTVKRFSPPHQSFQIFLWLFEMNDTRDCCSSCDADRSMLASNKAVCLLEMDMCLCWLVTSLFVC